MQPQGLSSCFVNAILSTGLGQRFRLVGDVHQRLRIAVTFSAVIDFQLHAEIARAFAVEDGVGLEVVVVDGAVFNGGAARTAIQIVRVIGIPAVVGGDDAPTADAPGVVPVVAFGTDGEVVVLAAVVDAQEAAAAVGADEGQIIQAVLTVEMSVELGKLAFSSAAMGTDTGFGHGKIPPKCKFRPPGITRRPSLL